jgi:2-methylcitrate dehydratase PrpD
VEEVTERLARFISSTRWESLPGEVIEIAKLHILDTLGVLFAGSREEIAEIVKSYIQSLGSREECSLLTQKLMTSAPYAAFGNGILGHVLDFDDYEVPFASMAHPSVAVLPAVIALGEKLRSTGKECVEAYLAGMEVISRVGRGVNPDHYDKGWHSTGTVGVLGSASASSKLLKLDPERTKMAIGIACSTSSGLRGNFGTMTKSFHAGHAARCGVESAMLASLGFTASKQIIEGDLGFSKIFTEGNKYDLRKMTETLGDPFWIMSPGVGLKPYPSCGATHSFLDGALGAIREHDIKAEDVDSVECGIIRRYTKMLIHSRPRTGLEGKFSLQFCIALALQERSAKLSQFTDSKVREATIQELIKRTTLRVIDETGVKETDFPPMTLTLRMKNGTTYPYRMKPARGNPFNPLSTGEIINKFFDCATLIYPREQAQQILERVMNIEKLEDISELVRLTA